MNSLRLVQQSLKFYWRNHLTVVLGAMTSTAILVGALVVGDSVRYSLQQIVYERLGETEYALVSSDRYFSTQLADELAEEVKTVVAPLLQTNGIAIVEGGQMRVNRVQVLGVDARFGKVGKVENLYENLFENEAIVNEQLAEKIGLEVGDNFLLRIEKLDYMPKDAPLAPDSDLSVAKRYTVKAIAGTEDFGKFNLKSNQLAPDNVYLSLSSLSQEMELENRANVLLIAGKENQTLEISLLESSLPKKWTLADAGLKITKLPGENKLEIRTDRIFLDSYITDMISQLDQNTQPIFTYFINEIRLKNRVTPYSFITGGGEPYVPKGFEDNEIVINNWLAQDLGAQIGDEIELAYYIIGPKKELIEKVSKFTVKSIVPIQDIYLDRYLMPDFPGLAEEENCRDWAPGIPIDLDKIRKKDEKYWDDYGGTPKGYVTLSAAQKMWSNRFGNLTAIRILGENAELFENKLKQNIDPGASGLVFRPVKEDGLRASSQSVDFAQLFIGLSFFIIIAALLLTGLLFAFSVEHRTEETGLFLALGFSQQSVKKLVLSEGAILAFGGGILGSILGIVYNQLVLAAIRTIWKDIVGTSAIGLHIEFNSILIGALIGMIMAFLTMWIVIRKQLKQTVVQLQKGLQVSEITALRKKTILSWGIAIVTFLTAITIIGTTSAGRGREASASFFMAGSLLLISGISITNLLIHRLNRRIEKAHLSITSIGIRNNVRRRFRSLALIGLLASGIFIVFTVGANRSSATKDAGRRESGTGGFFLWAESSIPILYDLNTDKGQEFYNLNEKNLKDVNFLQFRVKDGDDASCLNLNRVSTPRLLGVDPEELAARKAFTFVRTTEDIDLENPWLILNKNFENGVIPGVADQTVIVWGLGKAVGDTLNYIDESGRIFKIKLVGGLANSIFQGNIIISEKHLVEKYPSNSGYRILLIEAPFQKIEEVSKNLVWALQDVGLNLTPTAIRLAEFSKVENTYLSIFLILGGLGVILGSLGIGIVILRTVMERRGELALFRAIGFNRDSLNSMISAEYIVLLFAGILCGVIASLIAVLPALMTPGTEVPYLAIILILLGIFISGIFWIYIATIIAMRGNILPALRNE